MIAADVHVCRCICHRMPAIQIHKKECCRTPDLSVFPAAFSDPSDRPSRSVPVAEQTLRLKEIRDARYAEVSAHQAFIDAVIDGMNDSRLTAHQISKATGMSDRAIYQIRKRHGGARTYLKH